MDTPAIVLAFFAVWLVLHLISWKIENDQAKRWAEQQRKLMAFYYPDEVSKDDRPC